MTATSLSMDLLAMHMTLSGVAREASQQQGGEAPHRPNKTDLPSTCLSFFAFTRRYGGAGFLPGPDAVVPAMQGHPMAGSSQSCRGRRRQLKCPGMCRRARCCALPRKLRL